MLWLVMCLEQAWYWFQRGERSRMKRSPTMATQLDRCFAVRQRAANELQNEVNQILASALLWIRFAKTENNPIDSSVRNAELGLQEAIERVRALHVSLLKDLS